MSETGLQDGVLAVIGDPIEHSLSPAMQNAAFRALGLDCSYHAFRVAPKALARAVQGMTALEFIGFNVTVPHKEAVIPLLDEVDAEARLIGAVNTVLIRDGRTKGSNTDAWGFAASLREKGLSLAGKKVLIVGAGGAARAVAVAAARGGAALITVANRSAGRAQAIAGLVSELGTVSRVVAFAGRVPAAEVEQTEIIVNATPVGMYPHEDAPPVIDTAGLHPYIAVCDLVYRPRKTSLLEQADRAGCTTVGGLGMLLFQGARAFELFMEKSAPLEAMRRSIDVGN